MARTKAKKAPAKKAVKKPETKKASAKTTKTAKTTKATKAAKTTKASSKSLKISSEKLSKVQIIAHLAERLDLEKKTVKLFFDELSQLIEATVSPKGYGQITLPIGIKVKRHEKPAQKARMGRNPFTGEDVMIKAKPKRKVVKVVAMKSLKSLLA